MPQFYQLAPFRARLTGPTTRYPRDARALRELRVPGCGSVAVPGTLPMSSWISLVTRSARRLYTSSTGPWNCSRSSGVRMPAKGVLSRSRVDSSVSATIRARIFSHGCLSSSRHSALAGQSSPRSSRHLSRLRCGISNKERSASIFRAINRWDPQPDQIQARFRVVAAVVRIAHRREGQAARRHDIESWDLSAHVASCQLSTILPDRACIARAGPRMRRSDKRVVENVRGPGASPRDGSGSARCAGGPTPAIYRTFDRFRSGSGPTCRNSLSKLHDARNSSIGSASAVS